MTITRRGLLAGVLGGTLAPAIAPIAHAQDAMHDISIRDFEFVPDNLAVNPGDRIRFTNHDLAPHTATGTDGTWDTGTLEQGESRVLTVTSGWSSEYVCAFHPAMTARLTIG